jgi:hypothetical protein
VAGSGVAPRHHDGPLPHKTRLCRMYAGRGFNSRLQNRRYLSLDVWPSRQARNAAAACSRSSALLNLRRGCFGGGTATDVAPLISSTPCRRIRRRCFIRDQFVRPVITHFLATRAFTAKPPGRSWHEPAALPQRPKRCRAFRECSIVGAVEPEESATLSSPLLCQADEGRPIRPGNHTPAQPEMGNGIGYSLAAHTYCQG